jgi:hypothetical protein
VAEGLQIVGDIDFKLNIPPWPRERFARDQNSIVIRKPTGYVGDLTFFGQSVSPDCRGGVSLITVSQFRHSNTSYLWALSPDFVACMAMPQSGQ